MNLVVGASGFLGNEICHLLSMQKKSIRAMVRDTTDPVKD